MHDRDIRQRKFVEQLNRFAGYIRKAVWVDTLTISSPAPGTLRVEATWKEEGAFVKDYDVAELPRMCRMRRGIIADLLDARNPLGD